MSAAVYRDEPGKVASGVMAVAVHVAFFVLLVLGVSWQHRPPTVVAVELWNNLPPLPAVKAPAPEPVPAPKLEIKPPPPPPPPVEVKPQPKVELKPAPEPKPIVKPDIALEKEKQEKARREREELAKAEARKKEEANKREELAKAEVRKKEDAEKQRIAALETERSRLEREPQEALKRLQQKQAAEQNKVIDQYKQRISEKIKRSLIKEPCAPLGNSEILIDVVLLPGGNLLAEPKIRRSSGSAPCDRAIIAAITKADPLPVPDDPTLFKEFRDLNLRFRPNE